MKSGGSMEHLLSARSKPGNGRTVLYLHVATILSRCGGELLKIWVAVSCLSADGRGLDHSGTESMSRISG